MSTIRFTVTIPKVSYRDIQEAARATQMKPVEVVRQSIRFGLPRVREAFKHTKDDPEPTTPRCAKLHSSAGKPRTNARRHHSPSKARPVKQKGRAELLALSRPKLSDCMNTLAYSLIDWQGAQARRASGPRSCAVRRSSFSYRARRALASVALASAGFNLCLAKWALRLARITAGLKGVQS
jgi:hypothetical protein